MINLNLINVNKNEAIADVIQTRESYVEKLFAMGFEFDYENHHFYGTLEISKDKFNVNIYKTEQYYYINIVCDNNSQKSGNFTVNKKEKENSTDISIYPLLSYLIIFKTNIENKSKKTFSEYVQSEKT
jgi:hypothetical protein